MTKKSFSLLYKNDFLSDTHTETNNTNQFDVARLCWQLHKIQRYNHASKTSVSRNPHSLACCFHRNFGCYTKRDEPMWYLNFKKNQQLRRYWHLKLFDWKSFSLIICMEMAFYHVIANWRLFDLRKFVVHVGSRSAP